MEEPWGFMKHLRFTNTLVTQLPVPRLLPTILAAALLVLLTGSVDQASAAKYKVVVGDGPGKTVVDIRTKGNRITAFAIDSRFHCPADPNRAGGGVLAGKAFGDDIRPNIPISATGKFTYRIGPWKQGVGLRGRFVGNEIRGSFFINTDKRLDPFGLTCWTGKSRSNPWVEFVAPKKAGSARHRHTF